MFATGDPTTGVWEVPAEGGQPVEITTLGDDGRDHVLPVYLPDGRAVLLTILGDSLANAQVAVLSRGTGDLHVLTRGRFARYSPTGHLVFGRDGGLWAVRFDRETLTTVGEPVQVVPRVATANSGAVHFDFSLNGSLTYLTEGTPPLTTLGWVGRDGEMAEVVMETSGFMKAPRLSPDGTRVALEGSGFPVYLLPDGPEILLNPGGEVVRISPVWTPGGSSVAHSALVSGSWRLESIRIDDGVPHVFLASEFRELAPRLSPNGRWVAYVSDQPGEERVFVQTFPEATEILWVSPGYGTEPVWSRDGRELFYRNATSLMTLPVGGGDEFAYDAPVELFNDAYDRDDYESGIPSYDVSLDGQRFLMVRRVHGEGVLHLVQNWFEELERLVPVD